jgi:hypothetical protein
VRLLRNPDPRPAKCYDLVLTKYLRNNNFNSLNEKSSKLLKRCSFKRLVAKRLLRLAPHDASYSGNQQPRSFCFDH